VDVKFSVLDAVISIDTFETARMHDFSQLYESPEGSFEIQNLKFEIQYLKFEIRDSISEIRDSRFDIQ
jgi:hypothetical protein